MHCKQTGAITVTGQMGGVAFPIPPILEEINKYIAKRTGVFLQSHFHDLTPKEAFEMAKRAKRDDPNLIQLSNVVSQSSELSGEWMALEIAPLNHIRASMLSTMNGMQAYVMSGGNNIFVIKDVLKRISENDEDFVHGFSADSMKTMMAKLSEDISVKNMIRSILPKNTRNTLFLLKSGVIEDSESVQNSILDSDDLDLIGDYANDHNPKVTPKLLGVLASNNDLVSHLDIKKILDNSPDNELKRNFITQFIQSAKGKAAFDKAYFNGATLKSINSLRDNGLELYSYMDSVIRDKNNIPPDILRTATEIIENGENDNLKILFSKKFHKKPVSSIFNSLKSPNAKKLYLQVYKVQVSIPSTA